MDALGRCRPLKPISTGSALGRVPDASRRPQQTDCSPPLDDDSWVEQAIADGCVPTIEIDGVMEVDCSVI